MKSKRISLRTRLGLLLPLLISFLVVSQLRIDTNTNPLPNHENLLLNQARDKALFPRKTASGYSAYFDLDEESHCRVGDSSDIHNNNNKTLRCIVPSPDGLSAIVQPFSRSAIEARLFERSAIRFPSRNWVGGRFFNHIGYVRAALQQGAACRWLVLLPDKLADENVTEKPEVGVQFDCVDFRNLAPNGTGPRLFHPDDDINAMAQELCPVLACKNFTTQEWGELWQHGGLLEGHKMSKKHRAATERVADRALSAYWGLRRDFFRCQACPENRRDGVQRAVVYVRGEDVLQGDNPPKYYGQPPLDYFLKSIRELVGHREGGATGRTHVDVLSIDRLNPVIGALEAYNFEANGVPGVNITLKIGEPFYDVIRQIFCSRFVVLSVSSMIFAMELSHTAEEVYLPRAVPAIWYRKMGADERKVYVYQAFNYSPYGHWLNNEEQRADMLSYNLGVLSRIHPKKGTA